MQLFPERRLVHVPAVRVGELHLSFDGALAIVLGRHEAYIGVRRVGAGGAVRALETVESGQHQVCRGAHAAAESHRAHTLEMN